MHSYLKPLHDAENAMRQARTPAEHNQLRRAVLETAARIRSIIDSDLEFLTVESRESLLIRGVRPWAFYLSALAAVIFGITSPVEVLFLSQFIGTQAVIVTSLTLVSYGTLTTTVSLGSRLTGRLPMFLAGALVVITVSAFTLERIVGGRVYAGVLLVSIACLGGVLLFAGQLAGRATVLQEQLRSLKEQLTEADAIANIVAGREFVPPDFQPRMSPFEQAEFVEAATKVGLCEIELAVARAQVEGERQLLNGIGVAAIASIILAGSIHIALMTASIIIVPLAATAAMFLSVIGFRAMVTYRRDSRHIELMSNEIGSMRREIANVEILFGPRVGTEVGEA
jgi:hypothetical protein